MEPKLSLWLLIKVWYLWNYDRVWALGPKWFCKISHVWVPKSFLRKCIRCGVIHELKFGQSENWIEVGPARAANLKTKWYV